MNERIDRYEHTNRTFWDDDADDYQAVHHDDISGPAWGAYRILESDLGVLGDLAGLDVLELGCGGAQASLAFAGDAARSVGLDLSIGQLRHAAEHVRRAGREMGLVCASASATPFRSETFDVVFCDHGAMSFCDPDVTVPEAARLLRPGGLLAFSISTLLHNACFPPGDPDAAVTTTLQSPMFGARSFDWGDGTIDFQLLHSEWIALFGRCGFVVEDLLALRPPDDARTGYEGFTDVDWARQWPAEEIWRVRRTGGRHVNDARRSGLVVPMPALEAAVGSLRQEWDPLARLGARAHVTVLFPFAAPAHVDDALLARVRGVVAGFRPHAVHFGSVAEFPDHVLYLEPDPAAPFQALTGALAAEFPEYPPYRGQFTDVIPHLTVAHDPAAPNARLRAELATLLPLSTTADRVELWVEGTDDHWTARAGFPMAGTA